MDLSCALDYPIIRGLQAQRVHLLLRLETWPEEGGVSRKALNVSVALDRSGSMAGGKLEAALEAVVALAERLSADDLFSLVTFDRGVDVAVTPGPVVDLGELKRRLASIRAGNATNLSGGWLRALSLVQERAGEGRLNRVLLLTDGQANVGVTDKEGLAGIARHYAGEGIVTTTLGFGQDFNEGHLTAIATAAGGHFHYISAPEHAATAFLQEFGEVARVFGQNCEVLLIPGEGIPAPAVLAPKVEGGAAVSLGDVRDRDVKNVLAAFDLPGGLPAGVRSIATVKVRYDAVRGKFGPRHHILDVKLTVDPSASDATPAAEVHRHVVWVQSLRLKEEGWRRLDAGDVEGCRRCLADAADALDREASLDPERFPVEAANLRRIAEGLDPGTRSAFGKELASQTHAALGQRGAYQGETGLVSRIFRFSPRNSEVLDDVSDCMKSGLKALGYGDQVSTGLFLALHELVENAIEHGCRDRPDGRVEVELNLSRNHAAVVVRDDGPGFDFKATLAREEAAGALDPASSRGRGLLLARRAVDSLSANDKGNEVTASVRRHQARFESTAIPLINERGVGSIAVIKVSASLDSHSVAEFRCRLDEAVRACASGIIIDLSNCCYMNSESLGIIIRLNEEMGRDASPRVVLVSPTPHVRSVIDLLGISSILAIARTIDEAKALLS